MKKVLISGTSSGIGFATAKLFLERGMEVHGLDIQTPQIHNPHFIPHACDVTDIASFPEINDVQIVVTCAGVQNSGSDLKVNYEGTKNVVERYAFQASIESVLLLSSSSAHTGFEFADYSASKGAVISYMKNVAWRLAKKYRATVNSISFGGVSTPLNRPVMEKEEAWKQIMDVTPLKKWTSPEEAAEWIYFLTTINSSCTGQDILVDNGEKDLNCTFVWPGFQD